MNFLVLKSIQELTSAEAKQIQTRENAHIFAESTINLGAI